MTVARKKKKTKIPRIEILIILVFLFSFIMWAVSQCNAKKESFEPDQTVATTPAAATPNKTASATQTPTPSASGTSEMTAPAAPPAATIPSSTPSVVSRLYVTIDNLNVRRGPSLDSTIVVKLKLFEEVFFMNEVTEFTQEISMGENDLANEPWIKIRSRRGQIGWVYGAGVNYYKKKREPNSPRFERMPEPTIE